jgi:hypothetical protein
MSDPNSVTEARAALDDCRRAIVKLDKLCCEPGRSPRIAALSKTVEDATARLLLLDGTTAAADATLSLLEEAGGLTGTLQVGCCAPNRLPLYEQVLERLTTTQRLVNQTVGRGH